MRGLPSAALPLISKPMQPFLLNDLAEPLKGPSVSAYSQLLLLPLLALFSPLMLFT